MHPNWNYEMNFKALKWLSLPYEEASWFYLLKPLMIT